MTPVVLLCSKLREPASRSTSCGSPIRTSTLSLARPLASVSPVR